MRRVIANEWMSLDGVIQSSGSDDDLTGGFRHGGWHLPYFDQIAQRWVVEGYEAAGGSAIWIAKTIVKPRTTLTFMLPSLDVPSAANPVERSV